MLIALTWNGTGVLTTTTGGLLDNGNGNASFKGAVTLGQNKLISSNGNAIALPSSAGTLALTSQLPSIYSCWSARTTSAAGSSDGTYHFAFSALPSVGTGAVDCSSGSSGYQIVFNTAGTYPVLFDVTCTYCSGSGAYQIASPFLVLSITGVSTNSVGRLQFTVTCWQAAR